jgi:hypothetical protein
MRTLTTIRISGAFVWVGFICAISFMEAWVKFTAPEISITEGLAIGQVVFNALNKVEIAILVLILLSYSFSYEKSLSKEWSILIALVLLTAQTIYLLPQLSHHADIYLEGGTLQPSSLHITYIILEAGKVCVLIIYGIKQLTIV